MRRRALSDGVRARLPLHFKDVNLLQRVERMAGIGDEGVARERKWYERGPGRPKFKKRSGQASVRSREQPGSRPSSTRRRSALRLLSTAALLLRDLACSVLHWHPHPAVVQTRLGESSAGRDSGYAATAHGAHSCAR